MNGLDFDPDTGKMKIEYDGRTVATTDGTLICLSPTEFSFTKTIEYADPAKDIAYGYQNYRQWFFGETGSGYKHRTRVIQTCQTVFTRQPTEQTVATLLMAKPVGADIFVGQVKLVRTVAPTHQWFDLTLSPRLKESQWMPWNGSGLLEAGTGLARALHLRIDEDDDLVLEAEQSVMGAAGGFYNTGAITWLDANTTQTSREVREASVKGTPVWTSTSSPYRKTEDTDSGFSDFGPGEGNTARQTLRISGSNPCSTTDPTNYRSVYTVDVRGYFGRRS